MLAAVLAVGMILSLAACGNGGNSGGSNNASASGQTQGEAKTEVDDTVQGVTDTEIKVGNLISTIEYDYPTFHLSMDCFLAEIESGNLVLKEHEAARWLTREELDSVDWLPADVLLIDTLKQSKFITLEKEM